MKTERLLKVGTTLTVCRYPSRRIVNQSQCKLKGITTRIENNTEDRRDEGKQGL